MPDELGLDPAQIEIPPPLPTGDTVAETLSEAETVADPLARVRELETHNRKLENDLRSLKGYKAKQDDQWSTVQATRDEVSALGRKLNAMAQAQVTGDTDEFSNEIARIESDTVQKKKTTAFETQWDSIRSNMMESILDKHGQVLLDLEHDPALVDLRGRIWLAHDDKNVDGLMATLGEVDKLARLAEREKASTQIDEVRRAARREMDDAGVLDLATGAAPATPAESDWSSINPNNMNARDLIAEHKKVMNRFYR